MSKKSKGTAVTVWRLKFESRELLLNYLHNLDKKK
jgi:hypothetical protein